MIWGRTLQGESMASAQAVAGEEPGIKIKSQAHVEHCE